MALPLIAVGKSGVGIEDDVNSVGAFAKLAASGALSGQPIGSTANLGKFKTAVLAGSVKVALVGHSIMEGLNQNWRSARLSETIKQQMHTAFPDVTFTFANLSLGGRLASNFASGTYVGAANDSTPSTSFFRAPASSTFYGDSWTLPDLSINGSTVSKTWLQHVKDFAPDLIFFLMDLNETSVSSFVAAMQTILTDFQTAANWGGTAPGVVLGTSHTGIPAAGRPAMLGVHRAIRGLAYEYKVPFFDGGRIYELLTTGKDHGGNYDVVGEAAFRYDGVQYSGTPGSGFSLNSAYWSLENGFDADPTVPAVISPTGSTVRANPNTADFRAYRKRPAYDGRIRASVTGTSSNPQYNLMARRDPNNAANLVAEQILLQMVGTTMTLTGRYNGVNNTLDTATYSPAISNGSVHLVELECIGSRLRGFVNGKEMVSATCHHVQHEGWWGFGQPANGQGASFNVNSASSPIASGFSMEFMDPAQVFSTPLCTHADLLGSVNDFATNPDSVGGNTTVHMTTAANLNIYQPALAPVMRTLQAAVAR